MATTKTAISLNPALLDEVDSISRKLRVPRSRLFVLAIQEFIQKYRNRRLLEKINEAYEDGLTKEEKNYLDKINSGYKKIIKHEW